MTSLLTDTKPTSSLPSVSTNTMTASSEERSRCGFHSLPDELLFKIFSYLPEDKLQSTVSLVCRRWNRVSSDPRLYRTLVISGTRLSTDDALHLIGKASRLTSIYLHHRNDTDVLLSCLAQRLANNRLQNTGSLKTLTMTDCQGDEENRHISSTHLRSVLEHCTELSHLQLNSIYIGDSTIFEDIGNLLPSLTSLDLRHYEHPSAMEAIRSIAERPHKFPFTSLFIILNNQYDIDDLCLAAFCQRFQETLTNFQVKNYTISDFVFTALMSCSKLTTLELNNAMLINDYRLLALGAMPIIHTLTLGCVYNVTASGWISFFNMPHVRKIRSLRLIHCDFIDDNVVFVIAQNLKDLEHFELQSCRYLSPNGCPQRVVKASCNFVYSDYESDRYRY